MLPIIISLMILLSFAGKVVIAKEMLASDRVTGMFLIGALGSLVADYGIIVSAIKLFKLFS